MRISGLTPFSLIDFPGKISAVVFLGGCNFRCPFCHNPSLVLNDRNLQIISEDHLINFLNSRGTKIEGVVITGGEPTIHDELRGLILKIRKLGFKVKLDTNGSNPRAVEDFIADGLIDYVALDLKTSFTNRYLEYTGTQKVEDLTKIIRETTKLLLESQVAFEFRTTLVPSLHDGGVIRELAENVADLICSTTPKTLPKWYLQNFRPGKLLNPSFDTVLPFTFEELSDFQKIASKYVPSAQLRSYY